MSEALLGTNCFPFEKEGALGSKPTLLSWQLGAIHTDTLTLPPPLVLAEKMISHLNFGTRRDMEIIMFNPLSKGTDA